MNMVGYHIFCNERIDFKLIISASFIQKVQFAFMANHLVTSLYLRKKHNSNSFIKEFELCFFLKYNDVTK